MPSLKAIEEFKELYLQRYGVRLPDAKAIAQAGKLLGVHVHTVQGWIKEGLKTLDRAWPWSMNLRGS